VPTFGEAFRRYQEVKIGWLPISRFVVQREPSEVSVIFPSLLFSGVLVFLNPAVRKRDWHMRTCRIFLGLLLSIGSSIAVLNPAFSQQQHPGTMEQQLACTPDVWRLCGEHIPDVDRIVGCLRQNTPQLSGPCRAVFESNNTSPDPALPRRRDDRARSHQQ
jgi:hypothetical protein